MTDHVIVKQNLYALKKMFCFDFRFVINNQIKTVGKLIGINYYDALMAVTAVIDINCWLVSLNGRVFLELSNC